MNIIDISKWNGIIDFPKLMTNVPKVDGIIIKATEGNSVLDKRFFHNVAQCNKFGIPCGAYHFATWNNEDEALDAKQEAQFFMSVVKGSKGTFDLPLVLDIEANKPIPYSQNEMIEYVRTFLGELSANCYTNQAIYGSPGFLNTYLPKTHPFTNVKLWVADYTGAINPVPGWKTIWLHQYTQEGSVKGITGNVDMNRKPV